MRIRTILFAVALLGLVKGFTPCLAGGIPNSGISVSNVKPSGLVTGGGTATVTADVVVTGLADGVYDVTIVIYDYKPSGNTSKSTSSTVTITNGVGSVSASSLFPSATAGDTGIIQVQVQQPTSGASGAGQSNIRY